LAAGPKLDSREYKLMLNPEKFASAPQRIVARFWDRVLKDVIATSLDRRKNDKRRHKGDFAPDQERIVVFRDTKGGELNANGYLLRERSRRNGGRRELTLKFRTPDIFLAAQSWIGTVAGDDVEFEEDIAPLIKRTTFARPPTMRSMFSRSVTEKIKSDRAICSLLDVTALIPNLRTRCGNRARGQGAQGPAAVGRACPRTGVQRRTRRSWQ
jgi:hypothetical protein